jgi:hypothetical protein
MKHEDKREDTSARTEIKLFPIPGYENLYSISKCGQVWSHERQVNGKGGSIRTVGGLFLKPILDKRQGRIKFGLSKNGKMTVFQVARWLLITFREGFGGGDVDHVDRDRLNNDLSNLREVTSRENRLNSGMPRNNTSGFRGVCWCKAKQKWFAQIYYEGKKLHLGYFTSKEEAARAYDAAAKELNGEFAQLNFPCA